MPLMLTVICPLCFLCLPTFYMFLTSMILKKATLMLDLFVLLYPGIVTRPIAVLLFSVSYGVVFYCIFFCRKISVFPSPRMSCVTMLPALWLAKGSLQRPSINYDKQRVSSVLFYPSIKMFIHTIFIPYMTLTGCFLSQSSAESLWLMIL